MSLHTKSLFDLLDTILIRITDAAACHKLLTIVVIVVHLITHYQNHISC